MKDTCIECGVMPGMRHQSYCPVRIYGGGDVHGDPNDTVVSAVCDDLKSRSAIGLKKYGKGLDDRQDISGSGWLQHQYEELLDAVNYVKSLMLYGTGFFRKVRQRQLNDHGKAGFGEKYFTVEQRAMRFFEETAELMQAAGVPLTQAMAVLTYSYNRPVGELNIEIGQVGVTLCMLAETADIDVEEEERAEAERFLAKSVEMMQARLKEKLAGGMPTADDDYQQ